MTESAPASVPDGWDKQEVPARGDGDLVPEDTFAEGLIQAVDAQHVTDDQNKPNAFARFKVAQGLDTKSFSLAWFVENEPDTDETPLLDRKRELLKTKEEREADAKAQDVRHGSVRDLCESLCSTNKSFQWKRWRIAAFTEAFKFKIFFISLVCINGIVIGVQADHDSGGDEWKMIELAFIVLFIFEILMKLVGFGIYFWVDAWNVADISIVAISVVGMIVGASGGLTVLRMIRIFRVTRVISFVTRLNCLVQAFVGALSSVMWVGVLLVLMVYIFAIMAQNFWKDTMPQQFGTVPSSMFTLFQMMTGDSWASMIVWHINTAGAWLFFTLFLLLGSFGLLNLLTGVFIESLMENTAAHNEQERAKTKNQRDHLISLISSAFQETDIDGGGTLDPSELPQLMGLCNEYREALDFVGLSYPKMDRACRVADYDHDERSYWERKDPANGENKIHVHHTKHRPAIPDILANRGYKPCQEKPEGVLEGELVDCLTQMDEPLTKADYFAIMKKLRRVQEKNHSLNHRIYGVQDGFRHILKACGGDANWRPPCGGDANWRPPCGPTTNRSGGAAIPVAAMPGFGKPDGTVTHDANSAVSPPATPLRVSAFTFGSDHEVKESSLTAESNLRAVALQLFDRYDLDCSGTLNTATELRQFTMNMMFTIKAPGGLTEKMVHRITDLEPEFRMESASWNFESALAWFVGSLTSCKAELEASKHK